MSGADTLDLEGIFHGSEPMAEDIGNKWLEWNGARGTVLRRWNETSQYVYATSTRETLNGSIGGLSSKSDDESGQGGWSHSTHIPKITEIFDNLGATYMSAVMPHDDFFKYYGDDPSAASKEVRRKVESYLKAKHRADKLRTTIQKIVNDYDLYGNCFGQVTYVREQVEVNLPGAPKRVGYIGPRVLRISPYDIVFNPLASDFEHSPKIIRSLKTIGELERDLQERPDKKYRRDVLDMAKKLRHQVSQINHEDFDKHCQLTFDGYGTASQYFGSGHIEVLDFYGDLYDLNTDKFYKNYVISVIDKKYVIRAEPLDTWTGRPYIFHAAWRSRPDNLWGMGPLDNLIGMQYLINHLENARADAFDQMIEPTRVEVGDVEYIGGVQSGKPGGTYRIASGEGSVTNLVPDTTVLMADNQIAMKMGMMEELVGLPRNQLGQKTPGEQTLGEVQLLDRAASKIFRNKIIQLEAMMERILNAELEISRINLDVEDMVSCIGEEGVTNFLTISRDDLMSNGKLVPMGSRYFERRQQVVHNFQLLQQALSSDPMALQHFSSIKMAKIYEEIMEMDSQGVVQPYVRVGEQAELMKLQNAAQAQVMAESQVDVGGEVVGPEEQQEGPANFPG